jgi:hypothetical protein
MLHRTTAGTLCDIGPKIFKNYQGKRLTFSKKGEIMFTENYRRQLNGI